MAMVSSSPNALAVLEAAGVTHYFSTPLIRRGVAVERGLPGRPTPDAFMAAPADLA